MALSLCGGALLGLSLIAFPLWAQGEPAARTPAEAMVLRIEANQAIQDPGGSIPLLAERTTWIRVFLSSAPDLGLLTGHLRVSMPGLDTVIESQAAANPALADPLRMESSLNFRIPGGAIAGGDVQFEVIALKRKADGADVSCANCAAMITTIRPRDPTTFRLRLIGFRYTRGGLPRIPRPEDFEDVRSWLSRAYPISRLSLDTVTLASLEGSPPTCTGTGLGLFRIRAIDLASGVDPRTRYFGLVRDTRAEDGSSGFMRGCSLGIPEQPDPTVVASGPAGSPHGIQKYAWDDLPSYAGWYTGHELGHTLGRRHPGECETGEELSLAPSDLNGINTLRRGYDGIDPESGLLRGADRWTDIMSYCGYRWISGYAYQKILERIVIEDSLFRPGSDTTDLIAGSAVGTDSVLEVIAHFHLLGLGRGEFRAAFGGWRRGRPSHLDSAAVATATPDYLAVIEIQQGSSQIRYPVLISPDLIPPAPADGSTPQLPNFQGAGTIRLFYRRVLVDEMDKPAHPAQLVSLTHAIERHDGKAAGHLYFWSRDPSSANPTVLLQANLDDTGWRVVEQTSGTSISVPCGLLSGHTTGFIRLIVVGSLYAYLAYTSENLILEGNDPCRMALGWVFILGTTCPLRNDIVNATECTSEPSCGCAYAWALARPKLPGQTGGRLCPPSGTKQPHSMCDPSAW